MAREDYLLSLNIPEDYRLSAADAKAIFVGKRLCRHAGVFQKSGRRHDWQAKEDARMGQGGSVFIVEEGQPRCGVITGTQGPMLVYFRGIDQRRVRRLAVRLRVQLDEPFVNPTMTALFPYMKTHYFARKRRLNEGSELLPPDEPTVARARAKARREALKRARAEIARNLWITSPSRWAI